MSRKNSVSTFVKFVFGAVSLSGLLFLRTPAAAAQAIIVTAPFAFSAGNQYYPAGTYQFTLIGEWSLSIRNANGGGEKFFAVRPEGNASLGPNGGLTFRNSENHQMLQSVYVPGTDRAAELVSHDAPGGKTGSGMSLASTSISPAKVKVGKQTSTNAASALAPMKRQ